MWKNYTPWARFFLLFRLFTYYYFLLLYVSLFSLPPILVSSSQRVLLLFSVDRAEANNVHSPKKKLTLISSLSSSSSASLFCTHERVINLRKGYFWLIIMKGIEMNDDYEWFLKLEYLSLACVCVERSDSQRKRKRDKKRKSLMRIDI